MARTRDTDGSEIRRRREALGCTRRAFARAAGISESYLKGIENAGMQPSTVILARIASGLRCQLDDISRARAQDAA